MLMNLKKMTGEELLLVSLLRGRQVMDAVDIELDRRALFGRRRTTRPIGHSLAIDPRHAA